MTEMHLKQPGFLHKCKNLKKQDIPDTIIKTN